MVGNFRGNLERSRRLIEEGERADEEVNRAESDVESARADLASAQADLASASRTDEEGRPVGDVAAAQRAMYQAQGMLAARQHALEDARSRVEEVRRQKQSAADELGRHSEVERRNVERLKRLGSLAFSENASDLLGGMAERLNEGEDARVALLESMGVDATPEYVSAGMPGGSGSPWGGGGSGGSFAVGGGSGGGSFGGGSSEGLSAGGGPVTPVGGALGGVDDGGHSGSFKVPHDAAPALGILGADSTAPESAGAAAGNAGGALGASGGTTSAGAPSDAHAGSGGSSALGRAAMDAAGVDGTGNIPGDAPDDGGSTANRGMSDGDLGGRGNLHDGTGEIPREWCDDNGRQFRDENGRLSNTTYTVNGYTYETDELGRVVSAEGMLRLAPEDYRRPNTSMKSLMAADEGESYRETDEGGHLIGHRFYGADTLANVVPQDMHLNRGDYKTMESIMAEALKEGKDVFFKVKLVYDSSPSHRPTRFICTYIIGGKTHGLAFKNENKKGI